MRHNQNNEEFQQLLWQLIKTPSEHEDVVTAVDEDYFVKSIIILVTCWQKSLLYCLCQTSATLVIQINWQKIINDNFDNC